MEALIGAFLNFGTGGLSLCLAIFSASSFNLVEIFVLGDAKLMVDLSKGNGSYLSFGPAGFSAIFDGFLAVFVTP